MTHPLRCKCGALTGSVETKARTGHSICYCEDCQAFIRFLGREADLLDARGGCENIQTLPKDVTFQTGVKHIACLQLSDKGMLRWYAACCNTPIGNTPATSRLPFVGLSRACLENAAPSVEQSFGPVWHGIFVAGARGEPKPKPFGLPGFILWMIGNRLRARFAGGFRQNPFFDTATDRPIIQPRVLTPAERARLREAPVEPRVA
jgi:hypothetical protein